MSFLDYVKSRIDHGLINQDPVVASDEFTTEVLEVSGPSIANAQLHLRGDLTKVKYTSYGTVEVGGYMQNSINGMQMITEFMTDALAFEFKSYRNGGMYTIEIDGKIANPEGTILTKPETGIGPVNFVKVTAKEGVTKKFRHFKIYSANTAFAGFYTESKDTMTSDINKTGRKFIFQLGDSYTFGTGGGFPGKSYGSSPAINDFYSFRESLGLDGIAEGIGGSAWTSSEAGRLPVTRVQTRLAKLQGAKPDFVSLSLGLNDAVSIASNITKQNLLKQRMSDCIDEVRKTLPGVPIIAISCATPVGPNNETNKVFDLVKDVCSKKNIEFIDVSDVIKQYNGWDLYTSNNAAGQDQNHPTPLGHRVRGLHMLKKAREAAISGVSLIPEIKPSGFTVTYIERLRFAVDVKSEVIQAKTADEAYWIVKSREYSNADLRIEIISVV